ncbi:hypothetical protein BH20ACT5_BH20ACT5_21390 [soil metagenome]
MLVLVLALGALAPPLLTGHASTHDQHTVATISLIAHVVAVSVWVGGLGALLAFWRRSPPRMARR